MEVRLTWEVSRTFICMGFIFGSMDLKSYQGSVFAFEIKDEPSIQNCTSENNILTG
jgi:hypothetical protein